MDHFMSVQCATKETGEVGDFIHDGTGKTVSPVFTTLSLLFPWMKQNGWKLDEYVKDGNGAPVFKPWRVSQEARHA